MASVRIRLDREEELTPDFLDLFSKLIINNADFALAEHLHEGTEVPYRAFHQLLAKSCQFKHGLKSPLGRSRTQFTFNFSSRSNCLVLLLDLSPYMLIYNHGTRSFPLSNLQEIALHLLRKLVLRATSDPNSDYRVSVVLFSVFRKEVEPVLLCETVSEQNAELLCEFVSRSIRQSSLPLDRSPRKESMRDILQMMFNSQEMAFVGIRAVTVISSFHEEETGPLQLFTPNWYTFALINTGGHFGSYTIDNQQLLGRIMPGSYFRNKFVFKVVFLENWEMTQLLTKRDPDSHKTVQEMFRSILFQHDGQRIEDILELLLRFQITFRDSKKTKAVSGGESVISTIKDNPNKAILKTYKVPADSFVYILRTRYVQGWQPVLLNFTSLVQNTKFKLRIQLSPNNYLYYEASRNQGSFIISIYHNLLESTSKDMAGNEKAELAAVTQRMDRINSYNFGNLLGQTYRLRENKYSKSSLLFANHEHDAVQQLSANSNEWGKYFKLKRICFRFTPQLNALYLQEFVNQISFILGRKISHTIFVRQSQSEKKCEKMDDIDSSSRRVLMTKVSACGSVIELELAFLHFSYLQIQGTIQSINIKVHNRRFKWGVVQRVPALLASYFRDPQSAVHQLFHRKWVLRTGSKHYRDLFRIYWQQILKKDNYDQIFPKGVHQEKHYYKLMEVRIAPAPAPAVQMIAFLRVRQPQERQNQLHFQLSMPPSLLQVLPYSKEGKTISVPDLIATLMNQLKMLQQQIVRLIDTYQAIHCRLLRHAINSSPKLVGQALQKENSELYDMKPQYFRSILGMNCREIMNKYYKQCKESMHSLAVPSKLLMPTELEKVEGDIDLVVEGKHYSFFLCTPYKFVYLHKREGSLYYKLVTLYYEQFNVNQNKPAFLQTIHQGLIANIREQTYIKDFRIFLEGNFKGGIAKIINNSQFTHKDEKRIQLQPLLVLAAPPAPPDPKSIEYHRIRTTMETFSSKLFELIEQFFPLIRVNYYFQIRADKQTKSPFNIQSAISRLDTELFMRASFISADGSVVDIIPTTLSELIMRNYADVLKGRAELEFCFYLKVKNSSEKNENSFAFVDYFIDRTHCLINDVSYEVERYSQTNRQFSPDQMHFLSRDIRVQVLKLQLIKQEQDSVDALCRHVEAQAMQALIRFRRVRQTPPEFLVIKDESPNAIFIEKSMLMRIKTGSFLEFVYRPSDFFILEHQDGKEMLQKYFERLRNFINASRLVEQLSETYELPLEPYELWLNDSANHSNNKIIIAKKKKVAKNPVTKYLRKNNMTPQATTSILNTVSSSKLVPLSLIYRNFLPLNERIPANQGLQALKEDQIFKLSEIHNLKNTYLFLNFTDKEHIIFHFQQRDDETALKELAQENRTSVPRCKKYLLYYVFCANPLVKRENIQKLFYQLLKQAVNRKLFDEVSTYLLTHSDLIQDDEEFFIRGGGQRKDTKEFKFDLPQHFYREQLMRYLQQHIEIYHYSTAFRSETEQKTPEDHRFLQSIRVIEPSNIENTKIYSDLMRELNSGKRVQSSQEVIENSVSASTNFDRNRFSDFKGAESSVSMLRSTDGFFFDGQGSCKYEYAEGHWLFNSTRPRLNLAERFGKCLYLLRVKIREQSNKNDDRECLVVGRHNFLYTSWHEESELAEFKKYLLKRNSAKMIRRDSFIRCNIAFQITDHVGSLKIPETEQAFSFITRATIAEYYLENYFYVRYKFITGNIYMAQSEQNPRGSLVGVPEKLECSSGSSKTLSAQERAGEAEREAMMELLEWKGEVEAMLEQIGSLLFFRYKSSTILVRDIVVYFSRFLQEFHGILAELHKGEDVGSLRVLIYLEEADEKWSFWCMDLKETAKLQENLQVKGAEPTAKLGFILTDYLEEITAVLDNILHKKETPHGSSAKLEALKYLQNIRAGDKTKQYWFRRSLFVSFEMSYEHFTYSSYNLRPQVDRQVKEWLTAIDCWLNQKSKLLRFIKNVKENSSYEINLKPTPERKTHSFYDLRYLERPFVERQESEARPVVSMYRLLINLTFVDFPLARKEKEEQEGRKRVRYLHHCVQIRELLEILQSSPVNYVLFGSYKGTEKFVLERLGRQYISILREQYSMIG